MNIYTDVFSACPVCFLFCRYLRVLCLRFLRFGVSLPRLRQTAVFFPVFSCPVSFFPLFQRFLLNFASQIFS